LHDCQFRELARGKYLEALLVDGEDVFVSDVIDGGIRHFGLDGTERGGFLPDRMMVGGLLRNHDGKVLVSGQDGIVWFDPASGAQGTLLDNLGDRPMRGVNEMRATAEGALLFGEVDLPTILRGETPGKTALFRLDPDGTLTLLADDQVFTNGMAQSLDRARFYHNQSFVGTFAYPLHPDGSLGEGEMILAKEDADGMSLDAEGMLWITGFGSAELLRVDGADGSIVDRVALPGPASTNVRFGGADMRDIYVTIVSPETAMALKDGILPEEETSALVLGRSPVAGVPLARARFDLR
jgi:sugar lactone lactonase YvrE